jgi:hypothetical protein
MELDDTSGVNYSLRRDANFSDDARQAGPKPDLEGPRTR